MEDYTFAENNISDMKNYTIEARGLMCPMPLKKLAQKIREIQVGEIIELQVDDTLTQTDLPLWCEKMGHQLLDTVENHDFTSYFIKRMK